MERGLKGGTTTKLKAVLNGNSENSSTSRTLEDVKKIELDHSGRKNGLVNMCTTCYLNATLQCLHACDEFKEEIGGTGKDKLEAEIGLVFWQ